MSTSIGPQHSTEGHGDPNQHRVIYIGSAILLGLLLLIAILAFRGYATGKEERDKAKELRAAFESEGLPEPLSEKSVARLLGTDGGAVCDDPAGALKQGLWKQHLSNGAGGPGLRPVIADRDIARGEELVIQVYCPEHLDEFRDELDELKFDDVRKD